MADDSSIMNTDAAFAELRAIWRRTRGLDPTDQLEPRYRKRACSSFELGVEAASELGAVTTTADPLGRSLPIALVADDD